MLKKEALKADYYKAMDNYRRNLAYDVEAIIFYIQWLHPYTMVEEDEKQRREFNRALMDALPAIHHYIKVKENG